MRYNRKKFSLILFFSQIFGKRMRGFFSINTHKKNKSKNEFLYLLLFTSEAHIFVFHIKKIKKQEEEVFRFHFSGVSAPVKKNNNNKRHIFFLFDEEWKMINIWREKAWLLVFSFAFTGFFSVAVERYFIQYFFFASLFAFHTQQKKKIPFY